MTNIHVSFECLYDLESVWAVNELHFFGYVSIAVVVFMLERAGRRLLPYLAAEDPGSNPDMEQIFI